jgi:hypothetical protein
LITQNKQYYELSNEEIKEMSKKMRKMGYERFYNLKPKSQKLMSKLEWKFKCFMHRTKIKIENSLSYFLNNIEEE